MKILIIDNYDSFVYNLYQYFGSLGNDVIVIRSDKLTLEDVSKLAPDKIVISPGPGSPEDRKYFGVCLDVIKRFGKKIPILGVCLGHQGIIYSFGGRIVRAKEPMHGKTSSIKHNGKDIFKDIPNPIIGTRYHSLVGEKSSLPQCLEVTATSLDDKEIMAIKHKEYPIYGVQFHPEAIMTQHGMRIIENFLVI